VAIFTLFLLWHIKYTLLCRFLYSVNIKGYFLAQLIDLIIQFVNFRLAGLKLLLYLNAYGVLKL